MTNWISWLGIAFAPSRRNARRRSPATHGGGRKKAILKARNLGHTFGAGEARSVALRQVALELYRGELTLFMGPSGSGKSTLLSVISGLMRPNRGQVLALGQDYWK